MKSTRTTVLTWFPASIFTRVHHLILGALGFQILTFQTEAGEQCSIHGVNTKEHVEREDLRPDDLAEITRLALNDPLAARFIASSPTLMVDLEAVLKDLLASTPHYVANHVDVVTWFPRAELPDATFECEVFRISTFETSSIQPTSPFRLIE